MPKGVSVVGSGIMAAQCALTLAEMGIDVSLITPSPSLDLDSPDHPIAPSHELLHVWPLLLRAASHPRVKLYTNCRIRNVTGKPGNFSIKAGVSPRYIKEELCTGCGKCEEECSVKVQVNINGHKYTRSAIHSPIPGLKTVPSAYCIDKDGITPCRANCPLGINVQGYIALIGKGKTDKALALINDVAPMAGVLGRLCTHPCETKCARGQIDSPVFIQSLHRYASDKASGGIKYTRKAPEGSRKEKIAIIGSGPAGLTAAWELARRGYRPTIFESHAVIGGMLATGIPRFRLPREIREKEVEAILSLGIDVRTGVTVGKDVTYTDLLDRGYKAFFLAIGAHQNNKLNIPGEDLKGVLDCISLLFSLNVKVGASVGSNIVVIGGGNSAVDSARSARRVSKGDVRILCVTDKMTAVKEEVDEVQKEGIPIDYNVSVVEILGDGERVTGVRCQKVKNVVFDSEGKISMDYIPDSEFILKADHVVIAIGQTPNSSELNIKNLKLGRNAAIAVDPLTLMTSIPGIFAGGDAVTGSNNVVSAMAAGLKAAESIDRYVKGQNLARGRTLEAPQAVEINVEDRKATPHKRARMPALPLLKRKGNYEETNLGLPEEIATREAGRCLNCAICCECLECEQVCELKAVFHQDSARSIEIEAERIVNFVSPAQDISEIKKPGVYNIEYADDSVASELARASSVALSVAIDLNLKESDKRVPAVIPKNGQSRVTGGRQAERTALFLCRCGDSISSVIDFSRVAREIARLPGVHSIREITQSCTEEGAREIKDYIEKHQINHVVLAACRCCNLDQICFSCTDRRVMCQNNLLSDLPAGANIEFTNIREQCAWVHKDDPEGATNKAIGLISTGIARAQKLLPAICEPRTVNNRVLIIGTGLSSLVASENLAAQGYPVVFISSIGAGDFKSLRIGTPAQREQILSAAGQLARRCIPINPWPEYMELNGAPGRYEAVVRYGARTERIEAGVVILDLLNAGNETLDILANSNLISRVMARQHHFGRVSSLDSCLAHSFTVRETAGIFIIVPYGSPSIDQQITMGEAAAARASAYLRQEAFQPRSSSVVINSRFCRGCGDCTRVCQYIEIKPGADGVMSAEVDPALCFGCGACISVCPTGAITQPLQSERGITAALENILKRTASMGEAE